MSSTTSSNKTSSNSTQLTLNSVRERVINEIADALQREQADLIEALPGTGKSRGVIEAASRLKVQIAVFTCRGREEQYDQFQDWCDKFGLSSFVLPSAYEDCPTVEGDHGETWKEKVKDLLSRGVSASRVHKQRDLPCEDCSTCPYMKKSNEDLGKYDVLLGHYSHAHKEQVLQDRVPVFDEFPGGVYFNKLSPEDVTAYLQSDSRLPFSNFTDLLVNRNDSSRCRRSFDRLCQLTPGLRDELLPFNQSEGHALSGLGVLTLLNGNDLDNGWEVARLGKGQVGLFEKGSQDIYVFDPPDLPDNAVALDGTPTEVMWNLSLGLYDKKRKSLNVQRVLDEQERREYVRDVQKLRVVPTTEYDKPYSSGTYTTQERDSALVTAVGERHGNDIGIISSKEGLNDLLINTDAHQTQHYGNIHGSDRLSGVDAGVILGSPHYSDEYIKRWGALAGIAVEPQRNEEGTSYGEFGGRIRNHMHSETTQALFRFSRQGDGATVYVHTRVLPEWIPTVAEPTETDIQTWSDGKQDIIRVLRRLGSARTSKIADESGLTPQYVRKVLTKLSQRDLVGFSQADDGRGGAKVYSDTGLSARNEFGSVDLPRATRNSGFSKQTPNNTSQGTVSKKFSQRTPQELREAHREAVRREERMRAYAKMERLRG